MILTMAPDSAYLLRREYKGGAKGEDKTVTVHGRWRVSGNGRVLYLFRGTGREASFTILAGDSLRMRDQADKEIVSELNYALARAGDEAGFEAVRVVRELILEIRVTPTPKGDPVGLEAAGDLAALLTVNETGTPVVRGLVAGAAAPFCGSSGR